MDSKELEDLNAINLSDEFWLANTERYEKSPKRGNEKGMKMETENIEKEGKKIEKLHGEISMGSVMTEEDKNVKPKGKAGGVDEDLL